MGQPRNAAEHVWGYFKSKAEPLEKAKFERLLSDMTTSPNGAASMKRYLHKLQYKYEDIYLKQSLYFDLP